MDRTALRAAVRRLSVVSDQDTTDAQLNEDFNNGVLDVASQYAWPWMQKTGTITLAAGTTTYALPTDLMYMENLIHDAEGRAPLERTTLAVVKAIYGDDVGSSDLPHLWYQANDKQITFVPTPSATKTVNVHYFATPDVATIFATDAGVPPWHSAFHRLLVDYALMNVWEREEESQRAQEAAGRYLNAVERMANYYTQNFPTAPIVVGGGISRIRRRKPFVGWPE